MKGIKEGPRGRHSTLAGQPFKNQDSAASADVAGLLSQAVLISQFVDAAWGGAEGSRERPSRRRRLMTRLVLITQQRVTC